MSDLTFEQKYEIPVSVRFEEREGGVVMEYGECGSHAIKASGIITLDEAKRLHAYLGSLPGVLPVHPALPQPPVEKPQESRILDVVLAHYIRVGTSASPGHWSYEAKHRGEGDWFAYCQSDARGGEVGCGWSSEPTNYHTREEAWAAAYGHLARMIEEALA